MNSPYEADYNTNYYPNGAYDAWDGDGYGPMRPPVGTANAYYPPRRTPDPVSFAMPEARIPGPQYDTYATDNWDQAQSAFSFPTPTVGMAPEPYYGQPGSFPAPYRHAPSPPPMHWSSPQPQQTFDPPDVDRLTSTFQQTNLIEDARSRPPPSALLLLLHT